MGVIKSTDELVALMELFEQEIAGKDGTASGTGGSGDSPSQPKPGKATPEAEDDDGQGGKKEIARRAGDLRDRLKQTMTAQRLGHPLNFADTATLQEAVAFLDELAGDQETQESRNVASFLRVGTVTKKGKGLTQALVESRLQAAPDLKGFVQTIRGRRV